MHTTQLSQFNSQFKEIPVELFLPSFTSFSITSLSSLQAASDCLASLITHLTHLTETARLTHTLVAEIRNEDKVNV